jgi:hypothetical protein
MAFFSDRTTAWLAQSDQHVSYKHSNAQYNQIVESITVAGHSPSQPLVPEFLPALDSKKPEQSVVVGIFQRRGGGGGGREWRP